MVVAAIIAIGALLAHYLFDTPIFEIFVIASIVHLLHRADSETSIEIRLEEGLLRKLVDKL